MVPVLLVHAGHHAVNPGDMVRVHGSIGAFRFHHLEQGKRGPVAVVYDGEQKARSFYLERISLLCARCVDRYGVRGRVPLACKTCDQIRQIRVGG